MAKGSFRYYIFFFLFLDFISVPPSHATEQQKQHDNSETEKTVNSKEIELIQVTADEDWVESLHETISHSVYQSAYWFDGFFTDDDALQKTPATNARIGLAWEPKSREWDEFKTKFRVRLKLPHFKDKLDLVLSDNTEDELTQLPLQSINTKTNLKENRFAAAVRFLHSNNDDRVTDTRIGITSGDLFVKARHIRRYAWDDIHGFRFEPSVFYLIDDGLGAKLLLEYDYQLNTKEQLRLNYSIAGSESFSGIRWKHGLFHLTQISDTQASSLGLIIEGERNGEQGFFVDKYTLSYRYRFSALKKWLFFEIEPFLEWPEDYSYTTTPGIAFRIEGFFYKN